MKEVGTPRCLIADQKCGKVIEALGERGNRTGEWIRDEVEEGSLVG